MIDQDQMISSYLKDISTLPVISRRRERALSMIINDTSVTPESKQLAVNELVEGNLRMVVKMAFESPNKTHLIDMISDGNMGLVLSAVRYDAKKAHKGARFGTYARYWVKRCMHKGFAARGTKILHIPPNALVDAYVLGQIIEEGHGTSSFILKTSKMRYENAKRILGIKMVSLHKDDGSPIDIVDESNSPDEDVSKNDINREIELAMNKLCLTDEQRELVMSVYCNPDNPALIRDLARKYGVSISTIKMRKKKILSGLRRILSRKLGQTEIHHALTAF